MPVHKRIRKQSLLQNQSRYDLQGLHPSAQEVCQLQATLAYASRTWRASGFHVDNMSFFRKVCCRLR